MDRAIEQFWTIGSSLWPNTYGAGLNDLDAGQFVGRFIRDVGGVGTIVENLGQASWQPDSNQYGLMRSAAKWVHCGCRMISPEPSAFAAFAFTNINRDSLREVRIPWPSFAIELPSIEGADGHVYKFAALSQFDGVALFNDPNPGKAVRIDIISEQGGALHRSHAGDVSFADLFDVDDEADTLLAVERIPDAPGDTRIRDMVLNAVFGCLYTMQHTRNWRAHPFNRAAPKMNHRGAPPPHRNIIIGSPIKIDLMPEVQATASGRSHGSPTVQTLVRGHYKRQVIGAGRLNRKVIWVEPYWRGPEDAPILARPYGIQ